MNFRSKHNSDYVTRGVNKAARVLSAYASAVTVVGGLLSDLKSSSDFNPIPNRVLSCRTTKIHCKCLQAYDR